jgi:hypothetical protein
MVCDLGEAGITSFGAIGLRRSLGGDPPIEAFYDGSPMVLARWPNRGFAAIPSVPSDTEASAFRYFGERPTRWADEGDLRACGYWSHDWCASHVAVDAIDPRARIIHTKPPHSVYGFRRGGRWFAYNALSELDAPGEWYLDRESGLLYLWPPEKGGRGEIEVSMAPGLVRTRDACHVRFEGLTFEMCRGDAIEIRGGEGIVFAGCEVRNTGGRAAILRDGVGHRVIGCDICDNGTGGILCQGGDRGTLTSAGFIVENNVITRCSRWQRTHSAALNVYGVGCRVTNNLFYDIPHTGTKQVNWVCSTVAATGR